MVFFLPSNNKQIIKGKLRNIKKFALNYLSSKSRMIQARISIHNTEKPQDDHNEIRSKSLKESIEENSKLKLLNSIFIKRIKTLTEPEEI